jgi:hypothetical protein
MKMKGNDMKQLVIDELGWSIPEDAFRALQIRFIHYTLLFLGKLHQLIPEEQNFQDL